MRGVDLHILGPVCPPTGYLWVVSSVIKVVFPVRLGGSLKKIASETAEYPDGEPSDSLRIALFMTLLWMMFCDTQLN